MIYFSRKIFLKEIQPPAVLFSLVVKYIEKRKKREAKIRLGAIGLVAVSLIAAFIPILEYAANEFYTSGFYEYLSLFFTSLRHGYGQDVFYSLIDALPSLAVLLFVAIGVALVISICRAVKEARLIFFNSSSSGTFNAV